MYKLVISRKAARQLVKMDKGVSRIIVTWLRKNIDGTDNPRIHGKGLTADKSGIWRYRIGDYRILADIKDTEVVVQVLEVGHRKDIYKKFRE